MLSKKKNSNQNNPIVLSGDDWDSTKILGRQVIK